MIYNEYWLFFFNGYIGLYGWFFEIERLEEIVNMINYYVKNY